MVQSRPVHSAFTLIELLATITIVAVLISAALYYVACYTSWARLTTDKHSLNVLNDALDRYKCEGGDVKSLTHNADIGRVLNAMQHAITAANGQPHQVMLTGVTYPARSLTAMGDRDWYHFIRFNSYYSQTLSGGGSGAPSGPPPLPDVTPPSNSATMAGNGVADYSFTAETSSGFFAVKDSSNKMYAFANDATATIPSAQASLSVWSCVSATDPTPSGDVTQLNCAGGSYGRFQLASMSVTGLTNLQTLYCNSNAFGSLDVSGLANLQYLQCGGNTYMTSLNTSGCTSLTTLSCGFCYNLTSININGCAGLTGLDCSSATRLASLKVTGCTGLPPPSTDYSTNFHVHSASHTIIRPWLW